MKAVHHVAEGRGGATAEFAVSPARDFDELRESFRLVYAQYLRSGLTEERASKLRFFLRDLCPHTTTLVAAWGGRVVGTAAITIHGPTPIPCAPMFPAHIQALSGPGRTLAEGTKFASDRCPVTEPRGVGRMSAVATELLRWLFAWCCVHRVTDWVLVVHPRVRDFYVGTLGFDELSTIDSCGHVRGNPGTLLRMGVREVLRGERVLPVEGQALFFSDRKTRPLAFQELRLKKADITVLLLDDKEVLANATIADREVLKAAYPKLPLARIQALVAHALPHPVPQVGEAYRRLPIHEANVVARPFPLRAYLREIQLVLDVMADECSTSIQLSVEDEIPDALFGSPDLLGRMLFILGKRQLDPCSPTPYPWMHLAVGGREGPEISLLLTGPVNATLCSAVLEQVREVTQTDRLVLSRIDSRGMINISIQFLVLDEVSLRMGEVLRSPSGRSVPLGDARPSTPMQNVPLFVLVVDDNLVTRILLERLLSKWGHRVTVAVDGVEASELAGRMHFDLVLLDVQMPRRGGFETVAYLRHAEEKHRRATYICALTSFVMLQDAERCIRAGMDGYLGKPVHVDELQQVIGLVQARLGAANVSARCL